MSKVTRVTTDGGYTSSGVFENPVGRSFAKSPSLRALQAGERVVYAMRLPDGVIKIGCCKDLANRSSMLHGQILGFRFGDFEDEKAIHATLVKHRARGREYYRPTPEVMAVVNELCRRCNFGIGHMRDNPDLLITAADYLRAKAKRGVRDAAA